MEQQSLNLYSKWGGLLYETILLEDGPNVVTQSPQLERFHRFVLMFEQDPLIVRHPARMAQLLYRYIHCQQDTTLGGSFTRIVRNLYQYYDRPIDETFVNYINSPLLDQMLKVYVYPRDLLPNAWYARFPIGHPHRQTIATRAYQHHTLDPLYIACRLGCFELAELLFGDKDEHDSVIYGLIDGIVHDIDPTEPVRKWHSRFADQEGGWLKSSLLYATAARIGNYELAEKLFTILCKDPLGRPLYMEIGTFPCFPGWSEAYARAQNGSVIDWMYCFKDVCAYGGRHTDPALLQIMLQQFVLEVERDTCIRFPMYAKGLCEAAQWGHVAFLDQLLTLIRNQRPGPRWLYVWRHALDSIFFGALRSRLRDIVPIATMLARHRVWGEGCFVFDLNIYGDTRFSLEEFEGFNHHEEDRATILCTEINVAYANTMRTVFQLLFDRQSIEVEAPVFYNEDTVFMVWPTTPIGLEYVRHHAMDWQNTELLKVIDDCFPPNPVLS
jgi:hypothetical protein